MFEKLKAEVCKANKLLKENNLVRWTSGNVSCRVPDTEYVIIKPSGVHFEELSSENMVVVDLNGKVMEGELKPSVDTESHLYVYKEREDVNSVVHTHSPFATSFAIRGQDLPSYTTTAANVFNHRVPCSDFATIGAEDIGREIVDHIGECPAILMKSHGVFTVGSTIEKALKAAVVLEETAEYAYYATLQEPELKPLSSEIIASCNQFYAASYGQN
ncbi:L-ribulose-5-phosphate 4-epimerase [Virgibacillus oceani]|uniref:L-ribulose-5-phosphate 4-epimerase n=1 Tax=Virgibacillus oceani TaxID=1479511 RepID=A0A917M2X4_9BACI|nr:L-ribulose-5-phosphate 4-epimerase [Virgibacillus oceani]GGG73593.1 L-ribulose-5-phosphate 4-epimerase [Virgibacillus oceani]